MYLLFLPTESIMTQEEVRAIYPEPSLGFSEEGLEGLPIKILPDPEPLENVDRDYWRVKVVLKKTEEGSHYLVYEKEALYSVDDAFINKENEINLRCQNAILSQRFESNAVGTPHFYGADQFDQGNIQGNVLYAVSCLVQGLESTCEHYCYTATGEKVLFPHTPEQMIQVGKDLRTHVLSNVVRANVLKTSAKEHAIAQDYESLVNVRW